VVTPEEWLANFEATIADVKQKVAQFREDLESSGATESSEDGTVTVTVAPNGALTDLRIADSAMRGSGGELASRIMMLARRAQRSAAVHVAEAFTPLAGEDSEALHMVTGYLPAEDEEEHPGADPRPGYVFTEEPAEEQPPARTMEPPAQPRRPRSSTPDDDEDFGGDHIFGRRDGG
jgi:DNA-binding protein YbaB